MRAPDFWFEPPPGPVNWRSKALAPLAAIYAWGTARRMTQGTEMRSGVPVICVGNLQVGGTGKTPVCIALAVRLQARGVKVHIVSRGYGGRLAGPVVVNERQHTAADVGDEPLLLSAFAPVVIARDRAAAVRLAVASGAAAILMDDGFQNPAVAKDLSIVVVEAGRGFGNGKVLPAGPLREPIEVGLKRADLLLSIGEPLAQARFRDLWGAWIRVPHLTGTLRPLQTGMDWQGLQVFAFAGIGHPEKFFATLRQMGADVVRAKGLPDHQPLSQRLLLRLEAEAQSIGAQLVTTEKDAVRLPEWFRPKILTLPVRFDLDDWSRLDSSLSRLGL